MVDDDDLFDEKELEKTIQTICGYICPASDITECEDDSLPWKANKRRETKAIYHACKEVIIGKYSGCCLNAQLNYLLRVWAKDASHNHQVWNEGMNKPLLPEVHEI